MPTSEPDMQTSGGTSDAGELMLRREFTALSAAGFEKWGESQSMIARGELDLPYAVTAKSIALLAMLCGSYRAGDNDAGAKLGLATQMLNSACAAMSLLMSGYYQQSALALRHMLETGMILDLFRSDVTKLREWRGYRGRLDTQGFKTSTVMVLLDRRDGMPDHSRQWTSYRLSSNMAAHPYEVGLRLVEHRGAWTVGPSVHENGLRGAIEELAIHIPYFTMVALEALSNGKNHVPEPALGVFHQTVFRWQRRSYHRVVEKSGAEGLREYAQLLWGMLCRQRCPYRFAVDHITDWPSFILDLSRAGRAAPRSPGKRVLELLPPDLRKIIEETDTGHATQQKLELILVNALNRQVLENRGFYQASYFAATEIPKKAQTLLGSMSDLSIDHAQGLNRFLVESAYPAVMARCHDRLVEFLERLLDLHGQFVKAKTSNEKESIQHQIAAVDNQVDALVYELHELKPGETRIVEGGQ